MALAPNPKIYGAVGYTYKDESPVWRDFSDDLRVNVAIGIVRSRQSQIDQVQAGTAGFTLDNAHGWYRARNTQSPFYDADTGLSQLRLKMPWKITGPYTGGAEPGLFYGFLKRLAPDLTEDWDEIATVELVDGFEILAGIPVSGSFPSELSSARIARILDAAEWPSALRSIETGVITMQAETVTKAYALELLQAAVDAELGNMAIDGDGNFVFQNQEYRSSGAGSTIRAIFGGSAGLAVRAIGPQPLQDDRLWNQVTVQRTGGTEQTADDAESQALYGVRVMPKRDNLGLSTDAAALDQAQWLAYRYGDGIPEIPWVELRGDSDPGLWNQMLYRKAGDCIRVIDEVSGDDVDELVHIESVSHTISAEGLDWSTRFETSPARYWAFWVMDDNDNTSASVLDSTTVLGI